MCISLSLAFVPILAPVVPAAQETPATKASNGTPAPPAFDLSVDRIMRGSALYGNEPRSVRWWGDSQKIYLEWKAASAPREKDRDTWVVNRDGSGLRQLSEEEAKLAPPVLGGGFGGFGGFGGMLSGGMDRSPDRKWGVVAENGDLVLYEISTGKLRQLTRTADVESTPRFTRHGRHVTFVGANNLYRTALDSGEVEQLTDLCPAAAGGAQAAAPRCAG